MAPPNINMQAAVKAFNRELTDFGKRVVPDVLTKVHRSLTFQALARIVKRTPAKTGRARANWMVTVNRRTDQVLDIEPGPEAATQIAMAAGNAAIAGIKPFSVSYVDNNVVYIEALENGWSKLAPNGMVRLTFSELPLVFARLARKYR